MGNRMRATPAVTLENPSQETRYTQRARYFTSGDAFALKPPPVPRHIFLAERDRAFAADTGTGLIDLDLSEALELAYPATTPLILARYARIREGDSLSTAFHSSGEIYHVIQGRGKTEGPDDSLEWKAGDTLFLPGGRTWTHSAREDVVLYVVTNEPQLAFEGLGPPRAGDKGALGTMAPVHYPGERIAAELKALLQAPGAGDMSGYAVVFSSESMEDTRNIHPIMTLAMNSLPAGMEQRPHRHNSAAVTLLLDCEGGYSITAGQRIDWSRHAVMVTPPGEIHAHYNEGPALNRFLIVQDGGFHYHCRTMGFTYAPLRAGT